MERHLAVSAAILQREDLSALAAIEDDRISREPATPRLARFEIVRPQQGIPVIGMGIDAAEVGTAREKRLQRDYSFKTMSPTGTSFGVILAGVNVPRTSGIQRHPFNAPRKGLVHSRMRVESGVRG